MRNKFFFAAIISASAFLTFFFLILLYSLSAGITEPSEINLGSLWFSARLSLVTATISAFMAILVALPAAYAFSRYNFPLKGLFSAMLYLPFVVSPVTLGTALLIFFNTPMGSFIERNLIEFVFEVPGIIAAQFAVIAGMATILLKSVFDFIDPQYEHLARTLGADRVQVFFRVLLPMTKNGILSVFLLVWARALGEFGAAVMLAGATPFKTDTLPIAVFLRISEADITNASLIAVVTVIIGFLVMYFSAKLYAKNREPIL